MSTAPQPLEIIDLGLPAGGRYWRVLEASGHTGVDAARSAAIHARATGSVGATYRNGDGSLGAVERWPAATLARANRGTR